MARFARNQPDTAKTGSRPVRSSRSNSVSFLALVAISALNAAEPEKSWHSIEDIANAAEQSVISQAGTTTATIKPKAGYLDPRLKLAECTEALTTSMQSGSANSGRAVVNVRCEGETPWKLYVPVDIEITDSVLIASRSLAGGHVLTTDDVTVEQRDVSRLRSGYIARPEDIAGKQLKRQVLPGHVITPAMLVEQTMIARGQSVTITASYGGLSIETAGTALMDGAINERIQVENAGSKRVIEAIVRSPQRVEVLVN